MNVPLGQYVQGFKSNGMKSLIKTKQYIYVCIRPGQKIRPFSQR